MTSYRFILSTGMRLTFAATLFWVVGCKSGGAPAVASPIPSGNTQAVTAPPVSAEVGATEATSPTGAASQAAPAGDKEAADASPTLKKGATEAGQPVKARAALGTTKVTTKATTRPDRKSVGQPAAADKKKTNFKIVATAPALTVGGKGSASVSIAPMNGYKWNKEYPAKLIFKATPKNIKLGKTEFKQMAGDFKVGDKKTEIPVAMMANTAGKETVAGVLKFSICNETACIIEKADVALAVNVKP